MFSTNKIMSTIGAVGLAVTMLSGAASAADLSGSIKDAPAPVDEGRKFGFSWNIGATTDYVFRGISQNARDPAMQGGVDFTYGILYAGVWSSMIDFNIPGARAEVDLYAGIKPTLGPATFDFGVIYYAYPGAPGAAKLDYTELKAGVSGAFIPGLKQLTLGYTGFYSWEYSGKSGEVFTSEFSAAYELPKLGVFTPTVSALYGYQIGNNSFAYGLGFTNFSDHYSYWNAGLSLAVDKLTLDFRYWGTDISDNRIIANYCHGAVLQCGDNFVFTAKLTF